MRDNPLTVFENAESLSIDSPLHRAEEHRPPVYSRLQCRKFAADALCNFRIGAAVNVTKKLNLIHHMQLREDSPSSPNMPPFGPFD
jgi:hypothetical protein